MDVGPRRRALRIRCVAGEPAVRRCSRGSVLLGRLRPLVSASHLGSKRHCCVPAPALLRRMPVRRQSGVVRERGAGGSEGRCSMAGASVAGVRGVCRRHHLRSQQRGRRRRRDASRPGVGVASALRAGVLRVLRCGSRRRQDSVPLPTHTHPLESRKVRAAVCGTSPVELGPDLPDAGSQIPDLVPLSVDIGLGPIRARFHRFLSIPDYIGRCSASV